MTEFNLKKVKGFLKPKTIMPVDVLPPIPSGLFENLFEMMKQKIIYYHLSQITIGKDSLPIKGLYSEFARQETTE